MVLFATSGITHVVGSIFQPIFDGIAWLLAQIYGIVPNYAVAIAILTILIMAVLTPFTIKSTKSMMAMQRMQPEIKKLQQKYKGPENRQILNEELMKLYREEGINPLGGCLPMLLQAPFLMILYAIIRGLANKTKAGLSQPRYIPHSSKMYHNLIASGGQMKSFGMDLALKPFSTHSSVYAQIPFFVFVALAVALQYFQMWQMNNRNKKSGTNVPNQQQTIMRIMPIMFAYIYIIVPAAATLYMIVSTTIRIITQDIMFRTGISNPQAQKERVIPAREAPEPPEPPAKRAIPAPKNPGATKPRPHAGTPTPKPPAQHPRSKDKRPRKDR